MAGQVMRFTRSAMERIMVAGVFEWASMWASAFAISRSDVQRRAPNMFHIVDPGACRNCEKGGL